MFLCFIEVCIGQNQNCDYIYNQEQRYQCIVNSFSEQFYYDAFLKFKNTYKRNYKSFNEEQKRYSIFKKNYKKILKHNLDIKNQYYQNINRFTDLEDNEFQQKFLAEEQKAQQNRQQSYNYYYPTFYSEEESEDEIIDEIKEEEQGLVITPLIDQNLQQHLKKNDTNTNKKEEEEQGLVITPLIDQNLQQHLKKTDTNTNNNQDQQTQLNNPLVLQNKKKEEQINVDVYIQNDKNENQIQKKEQDEKKNIQLGSNFVVTQDQQQKNNIIQEQNKQKEVQEEKPIKKEVQEEQPIKKEVVKKRTKFYYKYNTKTKKIEKVYFN